MAALQVKQICMYLELADLPKIINTKLDQGEEKTYSNFSFSQVLIYTILKFSYNTVLIHIVLIYTEIHGA